MNKLDYVKLFGLSNIALESSLASVERELGHVIRPGSETTDQDSDYYPQFAEKVRREAAAMAKHYEIFYCLEVSIRQLIIERLQEEAGTDWWNNKVPADVRQNAKQNQERESATGVTLRSENLIDYTTFGELGQIIAFNKDIFGDTFRDMKAVSRILNSLNILRGPIAHCSPLADDEVSRLELSLKDWFRQMG